MLRRLHFRPGRVVRRGVCMERLRCFVTISVLVTVLAPARAGDELSAKIGAVINGPEYRQAHWGLLVVDAQDGKTIYEHNADRLFAPASTTKLYSCAAALAAL